MKDQMNISDRFNVGKKLGQGTFSFIHEAYDNDLQRQVALKIEKKDKNKNILMFEYSVLNCLKGLKHVANAYDFVKNPEQNLIVMDLLGNNLAKVRKCLEDNYDLKIAIQLLIEMLDAIEEVHNRGYIHRDVKASNFVLSRDNKQVFIVDFGLAKRHLTEDLKHPLPARKKADFRGTVSFASLNAHNNIDLSRRDDLWSLYFVILDFLNEKLLWREQKKEKLLAGEDASYSMEEVRVIKQDCLMVNPEGKLWRGSTKSIDEVRTIYNHLMSLRYEDKPCYSLIRDCLRTILIKNQGLTRGLSNSQSERMVIVPSQHALVQASQQVNAMSRASFMPTSPYPSQFIPIQQPSPFQQASSQMIDDRQYQLHHQYQDMNLIGGGSPYQIQQTFNFAPQATHKNVGGSSIVPIDPQQRNAYIKGVCTSDLVDQNIQGQSSRQVYLPSSIHSMLPPQQVETGVEQVGSYSLVGKKREAHKDSQNELLTQSQNQHAKGRKRDIKKALHGHSQSQSKMPSQKIILDMAIDRSPNFRIGANPSDFASNTQNGFYNLGPLNPTCVKQNININQNFYLSPAQFLLLPNRQAETHLTTAVQGGKISSLLGQSQPTQNSGENNNFSHLQSIQRIASPLLIGNNSGGQPNQIFLSSSSGTSASTSSSSHVQIKQLVPNQGVASISSSGRSIPTPNTSIMQQTQNVMTPAQSQAAYHNHVTASMRQTAQKIYDQRLHSPCSVIIDEGMNFRQTGMPVSGKITIVRNSTPSYSTFITTPQPAATGNNCDENSRTYQYDPRRVEQKLPLFKIEKDNLGSVNF